MRKLRREDLQRFGNFYVFNQGMTVIPHPKSYGYNVKVRWIAFVIPNGRWVIYHTYTPYFLERVGFKEEKLKQQFSNGPMIDHGTPLQDMVLVSILVPATKEAYELYDPMFISNKYFGRIDDFEDSQESDSDDRD